MALNSLNVSNQLPSEYDSGAFGRILRQIETLLNALASGTGAARFQAKATIPTTGTYAQDDIVWKTGMAEAGGVGNKYVIIGWVCVAGGTPGTWREMRTLTGN
tara:strand:+ start:213 stop:521 length:309 start_codon:yes stop_codon:yes gene_type:complete